MPMSAVFSASVSFTRRRSSRPRAARLERGDHVALLIGPHAPEHVVRLHRRARAALSVGRLVPSTGRQHLDADPACHGRHGRGSVTEITRTCTPCSRKYASVLAASSRIRSCSRRSRPARLARRLVERGQRLRPREHQNALSTRGDLARVHSHRLVGGSSTSGAPWSHTPRAPKSALAIASSRRRHVRDRLPAFRSPERGGKGARVRLRESAFQRGQRTRRRARAFHPRDRSTRPPRRMAP